MQNNNLRILFVDRITFFSLMHLSMFRQSVQTIWYFDPVRSSAQRWLRLFRILGLIRAEMRQIENYIGQVRNQDGDIEITRLRDYARSISAKIRQEQLVPNPLIKAMGLEWATDKVVLYFEKLVEQEMGTECLRIGLAEWVVRTQLHIFPAQWALLIERKQWFLYLEEHARLQGIQLLAYPGFLNLGNIRFRLFPAAKKTLRILLRSVQNRWKRARESVYVGDLSGEATIEQSSPSTIAIRYWHRKLSFDPTKRSEFFWLNGSGIPYSEVLLYDYATDKPLDAETLNRIKMYGIRLLGHDPGIPAWSPTWRKFKVFLQIGLKLILAVLTCFIHRQWVSLHYVGILLTLALDYAHWYDFFTANYVRVHIGTVNTSVGQVLALDALGGVSIAYQYSTGVTLSPPTVLTAGENVQFVFSSVFEQTWRRVEPLVDSFVYTGFIYDQAIQAVRGLDRVAETRRQLQANGVRFILCFFDENSLNRWDVFHWDDDAADDYEYLLKWLLADPTLGVVFKPKVSTNLFRRIARVSGLIDQAMQTGRCRFLTSDTLVGSIFPAEAALMADLCVGWLTGTTAALEAHLAGVRSVLINPARFSSSLFNTWGQDRVVFDNWSSLRTMVEKYRAAPEAYPGFGDWSPGLDAFDPFQDGQASLRMGSYIRWVYEALKQGAAKETALAVVAEKFKQRWGDNHIT